MTYEETLEYLFTQLPVYQNEGGKAYKPGLERVEQLLELCGNPHRTLATVHVAGTNGKGSTASMLASILKSAGYKVGLFTSPHLVDFRERIRVNGKMVDMDFVIRFVEDLRPRIPEGLNPSFFELTTAMAFAYFRDQSLDISVVETGMGGRLDCTNVIQPEVSVITNVSIDHSDFLGKRLGDIAYEKAGIIKKYTPVVLGRSQEPEVLEVIRQKAHEMEAPLVMADRSDEVMMYQEMDGGGLLFTTQHYGTFRTPLSGLHQVENIRAVLEAVKLLNEKGWNLSSDTVHAGISSVASVGLRGRLEVIQEESPRVVIDTGHNFAAWEYLSKQLKQWHQQGGVVVMLGMAADKEVEKVLELIPAGIPLVLCQAKGKRAMPVERLEELAKKVGHTDIRVIPDVYEAYEGAVKLTEMLGATTLFVGGSNFVVGELLGHL